MRISDWSSDVCSSDLAIRAGAVAVVALPEARVTGAAHVADPEPRRAFARLASRYYAPFPTTVAAVTGTNGKTSTVELARQLWRLAGHRAASIGTLGVTTADDQASTGLTTPDVATFLMNMAGLRREGVSHAAFEASSHGLSQYRIEGLPVRVAEIGSASGRVRVCPYVWISGGAGSLKKKRTTEIAKRR